jgi:hypothetical protein
MTTLTKQDKSKGNAAAVGGGMIVVLWALASGIAGALTGYLEGAFFQFLATIVLTGAFLGIAQWLVLRVTHGASFWWMPVTFIGWLLGIALTIFTPLGGVITSMTDTLTGLGLWEVFWLNTLNGLVTVTVMAVAQWAVLRRWFAGAGWWILAGAVGGLAQGMVGASFGEFHAAMSYGAGWLAYGVVTGLALAWLSNRNR